MNSKLARIKNHVKENRIAYISGAICGLSGLVLGTIVSRSGSLVNVSPKQILAWKSTQTVEVYIEALGDPGNIVQDTTTGTVYASQGQAARALGVSASRISENLAGKLPDVKGHVFSKIGKAVVPE